VSAEAPGGGADGLAGVQGGVEPVARRGRGRPGPIPERAPGSSDT
jgi:hypothetical protein